MNPGVLFFPSLLPRPKATLLQQEHCVLKLVPSALIYPKQQQHTNWHWMRKTAVTSRHWYIRIDLYRTYYFHCVRSRIKRGGFPVTLIMFVLDRRRRRRRPLWWREIKARTGPGPPGLFVIFLRYKHRWDWNRTERNWNIWTFLDPELLFHKLLRTGTEKLMVLLNCIFKILKWILFLTTGSNNILYTG